MIFSRFLASDFDSDFSPINHKLGGVGVGGVSGVARVGVATCAYVSHFHSPRTDLCTYFFVFRLLHGLLYLLCRPQNVISSKCRWLMDQTMTRPRAWPTAGPAAASAGSRRSRKDRKDMVVIGGLNDWRSPRHH